MALTVREYLTADGKNPFREWLRSLTKALGARIQLRVQRFELATSATTRTSARASGKLV